MALLSQMNYIYLGKTRLLQWEISRRFQCIGGAK